MGQSSSSSDFRALVHTPAELAAEYVAWAERIKRDPGITFGVQAIDKMVIPMRPGELISLIARPGHGKTSLLAYFAREHARRIMERDKVESEAVVYVTWEKSLRPSFRLTVSIRYLTSPGGVRIWTRSNGNRSNGLASRYGSLGTVSAEQGEMFHG